MVILYRIDEISYGGVSLKSFFLSFFPEEEIEKAIQSAIDEAKRAKVSGPRVTPFILKNLAEVSEGKALAASILLPLCCGYYRTFS